MKKIGRRGFLKAMSVAPAAAKTAANNIADKITKDQIAAKGMSWKSISVPNVEPKVEETTAKKLLKLNKILDELGIPEYMTEHAKNRINNEADILPEYLAMHSWSFNAKVAATRKKKNEIYLKEQIQYIRRVARGKDPVMVAMDELGVYL